MKIIRINNFTKKYGKVTAVDNISFDIEKNTIVGFIGSNGAGKTTTIRCMLDLIKPTSGSIIINDINANKHSSLIKEKLGYMPSDTSFYEQLTCLEIFKLVCSISNTDITSAYEYANYLELDITKKFKDLSLGNKKKVSIIQALLKDINILILDEPTNGLDPLMQTKFFELLLKLKAKGMTIFLSSHNLTDIQKYCDRSLIIKDGKIIDDIDMKKFILKTNKLVSYTTSDNIEESFEYDGNINDLTKLLASKNLIQLEIKNTSVEDEFIKYYKGD